MQEAVKKLFDAPWAIEEEAPLVWYCVIDSKDSVVANDVRDQKTVKRLVHLPELYDALAESTKHYCGICHNLSGQKEPKIEDLIENGCPKKRTSCVALDWLELLKKVRDGE